MVFGRPYLADQKMHAHWHTQKLPWSDAVAAATTTTAAAVESYTWFMKFVVVVDAPCSNFIWVRPIWQTGRAWASEKTFSQPTNQSVSQSHALKTHTDSEVVPYRCVSYKHTCKWIVWVWVWVCYMVTQTQTYLYSRRIRMNERTHTLTHTFETTISLWTCEHISSVNANARA